jgi:hypothetical protein
MSEDSDKTAAAPSPELDGTRTVADRERRVQQRFPFTAEAEVIELRSQARVTGRCSDLGAGGCYIDALAPFAVGAEVRILMARDSRKFEAEAVVTYAHPSLGMGLKFTGISGDFRDVLVSWIAELSGDRPAATASTPPRTESAASGDGTNILIVLNQLIALLIRKKILTENEGAEFLRKMFR